ncbi:hypothetical protein E6P70_07295 [Moraxella nonliquefaciens]|uniref:hypothetical protein n=2 Tax=Moraxella nonliquefaciens TaxID=478 RepID=UPI0024A696F2|nr:hypothetical protein [Moraxella nonliquefaciens]MDI4498652.1 hypothetical protein [Moraxella nonliquefaciens]MDI4500400.1 hypothetical protein [Moraxella nonliquefaciens]
MFNFNKLNVLRPNEVGFLSDEEKYYSFVGIRPHQGKMTFFLPKGFDNFDKSYENIKNLFFKMYRTFDKFCQNGKKYGNKFLDDSQKENTKNKNSQGAYIFTDEDNNEIVLYSKIDLIDKIFQTYQELEIESLIQELGLIEEVDYSKIENYLDKGIFLSNHAIFIENMVGYRNIVRGVPSELIELFCYIYKELAGELEKELSEQIKEISFNFSYKYLSPEQSLFSEHSFESTISILKDCLDNIHKTTAYKNYQYWDIYEAVEHFLYGSLGFDKDSNQGFWGINNFSYIWEEICNYFVHKSKDRKVLYCDTRLPLNIERKYLTREVLSKKHIVWLSKTELNNNFYFELNKNYRYMRPDLICRWALFDIIKNDFRELVNIKESEIKVGIISNGKYNVRIESNIGLSVDDYNLSQIIIDILYRFFQRSEFNGKRRQYEINKNEKLFLIKEIPINMYKEMINDFKSLKGFEDFIYLVDWKYYNYSIFENDSYKQKSWINEAIIKQLTYEFCLSQSNYSDSKISSQFCVPYYSANSKEFVIDDNIKLDCEIEVVKMNFTKIQEIYLND